MKLRKDDTGFGGYVLYQDADAFCYGVDAVLLADFAVCRHTERVADLGCGSGIIPLILHAKYAPREIFGVEKQEGAYRLALRNAAENGLTEQLHFLCGDVLDIRTLLPQESFDLVTSNPPYFESGRGPQNAETALSDARTETSATLEDFISAASYLLKPKGRLCMVHRPSRLVDLMNFGRKYRLEAKRLRMVVPRRGEAANIALIEFVKDGGKELKLLPELAVREGDCYSAELQRIYGRTQ